MNKELSKEDLWDEYSEYIDDDIFSLGSVAGTTMMKQASFFKAIDKLKEEKKKEAIAFAEWKDNNFFTDENILPYFRQYQVSKDYVEGDAKLFDYKDIYELFNQQK